MHSGVNEEALWLSSGQAGLEGVKKSGTVTSGWL